MLSFWTCADFGRCLNLCISFFLVWSVFYFCRQLQLQVGRFFGLSLCYDGMVGCFVPVYILRRVSHTLSYLGLAVCFYCSFACLMLFLGVYSVILVSFVLGYLSASWLCCLCDSATASEFLVFFRWCVIPSIYAWGLSMWFFWPSNWSMSCLGVDGVMMDCFSWWCLLVSWFCYCYNSATAGEYPEPSPCISGGGSAV